MEIANGSKGCLRGQYCPFFHGQQIEAECAGMQLVLDPWNTNHQLLQESALKRKIIEVERDHRPETPAQCELQGKTTKRCPSMPEQGLISNLPQQGEDRWRGWNDYSTKKIAIKREPITPKKPQQSSELRADFEAVKLPTTVKKEESPRRAKQEVSLKIEGIKREKGGPKLRTQHGKPGDAKAITRKLWAKMQKARRVYLTRYAKIRAGRGKFKTAPIPIDPGKITDKWQKKGKWYPMHARDERICTKCAVRFVGTYLQVLQMWNTHDLRVHRPRVTGIKRKRHEMMDPERTSQIWVRATREGETFKWSCHLCNLGIVEHGLQVQCARNHANKHMRKYHGWPKDRLLCWKLPGEGDTITEDLSYSFKEWRKSEGAVAMVAQLQNKRTTAWQDLAEANQLHKLTVLVGYTARFCRGPRQSRGRCAKFKKEGTTMLICEGCGRLEHQIKSAKVSFTKECQGGSWADMAVLVNLIKTTDALWDADHEKWPRPEMLQAQQAVLTMKAFKENIWKDLTTNHTITTLQTVVPNNTCLCMVAPLCPTVHPPQTSPVSLKVLHAKHTHGAL